MPGAVIVANQTGGAGAGTPGVAREDLWQDVAVELLVGTGGNSTYFWELTDVPPGSAATLTSEDDAVSGFLPDLTGTYRVRLTTNGGGPGNVQVLVFRVRFDNAGDLVDRGWALPAFRETAAESNYGGNTRGYAQVLESIFADIAASLTTLEEGAETSLPAGGTIGQILTNSAPGTGIWADGALPVWTSAQPPSVLLSWSAVVGGARQSGWLTNGVTAPNTRGLLSFSRVLGTESAPGEVGAITAWPASTVMVSSTDGSDPLPVSVLQGTSDVVNRGGWFGLVKISGDANGDVVPAHTTYNAAGIGRCGGQGTLTLEDNADATIVLPWPDGMAGQFDLRVSVVTASARERRFSEWDVERDGDVTVIEVDKDDPSLGWTYNVVTDADELQLFLFNETGGDLNISWSWDGDRQVVPT